MTVTENSAAEGLVREVSTILYIQITTLAATTVTELIASGHTNSGWAVFEPGRIRIFLRKLYF